MPPAPSEAMDLSTTMSYHFMQIQSTGTQEKNQLERIACILATSFPFPIKKKKKKKETNKVGSFRIRKTCIFWQIDYGNQSTEGPDVHGKYALISLSTVTMVLSNFHCAI